MKNNAVTDILIAKFIDMRLMVWTIFAEKLFVLCLNPYNYQEVVQLWGNLTAKQTYYFFLDYPLLWQTSSVFLANGNPLARYSLDVIYGSVCQIWWVS